MPLGTPQSGGCYTSLWAQNCFSAEVRNGPGVSFYFLVPVLPQAIAASRIIRTSDSSHEQVYRL